MKQRTKNRLIICLSGFLFLMLLLPITTPVVYNSFFLEEPVNDNTFHVGPRPPTEPEVQPETIQWTTNMCLVIAKYGDIVLLDCGTEETIITNEPEKVE